MSLLHAERRELEALPCLGRRVRPVVGEGDVGLAVDLREVVAPGPAAGVALAVLDVEAGLPLDRGWRLEGDHPVGDLVVPVRVLRVVHRHVEHLALGGDPGALLERALGPIRCRRWRRGRPGPPAGRTRCGATHRCGAGRSGSHRSRSLRSQGVHRWRRWGCHALDRCRQRSSDGASSLTFGGAPDLHDQRLVGLPAL